MSTLHEKVNLKMEIEKLRKELYEYSEYNDYTNFDIVKLSEKLDEKITKYMKVK